jgi:inorganic pyrophosphatase
LIPIRALDDARHKTPQTVKIATGQRKMASDSAAFPGLDYWLALDHLVERSQMIVDRPAGSSHPRYQDVIYPLDYGYLQDTQGGDGHGIDVWLGTDSIRRVTGMIATVDLHKRDAEQKILLGCTREEAEIIVSFHRSGRQSAMLLWRSDPGLVVKPDASAHTTDRVDLDRIRTICSRFPEADEDSLQGRPMFHVRRRRFAIFNGDDAPPRKRWQAFGRSLHFATRPLLHSQLADDDRFLASPHHGFRGWMALELGTHDVDWHEIERLLFQAYRHVANKKLLQELDRPDNDHI